MKGRTTRYIDWDQLEAIGNFDHLVSELATQTEHWIAAEDASQWK